MPAVTTPKYGWPPTSCSCFTATMRRYRQPLIRRLHRRHLIAHGAAGFGSVAISYLARSHCASVSSVGSSASSACTSATGARRPSGFQYSISLPRQGRRTSVKLRTHEFNAFLVDGSETLNAGINKDQLYIQHLQLAVVWYHKEWSTIESLRIARRYCP